MSKIGSHLTGKRTLGNIYVHYLGPKQNSTYNESSLVKDGISQESFPRRMMVQG